MDEITYPFLNFNGCTVKVLDWISNFIPHFTMDVLSYPYWDIKLIHVIKRGHMRQYELLNSQTIIGFLCTIAKPFCTQKISYLNIYIQIFISGNICYTISMLSWENTQTPQHSIHSINIFNKRIQRKLFVAFVNRSIDILCGVLWPRCSGFLHHLVGRH